MLPFAKRIKRKYNLMVANAPVVDEGVDDLVAEYVLEITKGKSAQISELEARVEALELQLSFQSKVLGVYESWVSRHTSKKSGSRKYLIDKVSKIEADHGVDIH